MWFDSQAEEAAKFYVSIFKNAKMLETTYYRGKETEKVSGKPEGSVLTVSFEILGDKFMALNGGPIFKFTEAISFVVDCKDQEEVDYYWEKLSEGGDPASQQCGWLKDKFGVSWQIVPDVMDKMVADKNPKKVEAVLEAMQPMKKLDLKALQEAYDKA